MRYKLKHIAPAALSFGIFMSLNFWGVSLVPIEVHVLLQSTSLLWAVVLARVINKESLDILESSAVVLVIFGAVVISLDSSPQVEGSALGLVVNWVATLFEALYLNLLRKGIAELSRSDNCLQGSMSPFEFTAFKCVLSSAVILVMSFVFECQSVREAQGIEQAQSWWDALVEYPSWSFCLGVLGCGFFLLCAEVTIARIAELASATTVAVIAEVKIVPQWLFSMLFFTPTSSFNQVLGAAIVVVGTSLYAMMSSLTTKLVISSQGLEWKARTPAEENPTEPEASATQKKTSETGTP
jgi:drug/metabolite transporter (DMT)-like permease